MYDVPRGERIGFCSHLDVDGVYGRLLDEGLEAPIRD